MILSSLIPWRSKGREDDESANAVASFHGEVDRWFERFFDSPFWGPPSLLSETRFWSPSLDVSENDEEITVTAEIPGVDAKDFDISVSGNLLTISGEKKVESEERKGSMYRAERRFGSFRRSINLPDSVDAEKVEAEYDRGILTVRLPKAEKARARRIKVSRAK